MYVTSWPAARRDHLGDLFREPRASPEARRLFLAESGEPCLLSDFYRPLACVSYRSGVRHSLFPNALHFPQYYFQLDDEEEAAIVKGIGGLRMIAYNVRCGHEA